MKSSSEIMNMEVDNRSFIDAIMEPHSFYHKGVKELFDLDGIHGMAHITGGFSNGKQILVGLLGS